MAEAVNQTGRLLVDGRSERDRANPPRPGSALARWLWPPRCLVCRDGCHDGGTGKLDLCHACADALPWLEAACGRCAMPLSTATPGEAAVCGSCLQHPPPLTEAHAACLYGAPLDRLLPRFKFHHDLAAGRLLAQLMAQAFAPLVTDWASAAALVPIPLHPRRLRERGYDQALELARPLARALDLPRLDNVLQRVRDTTPQSRLAAAQRQGNLEGAFSAIRVAALPAHVVLIDDVMTTGATLHAAADALRRAGVVRIDAWVCARVP